MGDGRKLIDEGVLKTAGFEGSDCGYNDDAAGQPSMTYFVDAVNGIRRGGCPRREQLQGHTERPRELDVAAVKLIS